MATIFNALNVGYSGLKTSQTAIDTTGHNIANAENPNYTRQRVVIEPNNPLHTTPGDLGLGAKIDEIVRIHDEFVYKRLKSASTNATYNQVREETLTEVSTHFPEIDKNGIYQSMQEYFNAWNTLSKNSDDNALKTDLAQKSENFTSILRQTRSSIYSVQKAVDGKLESSIDEINQMAEQIAKLNVRIGKVESAGSHANDLRDQRDKLELALSKLAEITVSKGKIHTDTTIDNHMAESGNYYHLGVGGTSIVDGNTFHPLVFEQKSGERFSNIYYERQDGYKFDITNAVKGGKVGALLALRDKDIKEIVDKLDSFASSLIVNTNNIYASHATTFMQSNKEIEKNRLIGNSELPLHPGTFKIKIYDNNGDVAMQRKISYTELASFDDIAQAINAEKYSDLGEGIVVNGKSNDAAGKIDDNQNNVGDDLYTFLSASANGKFSIRMNQEKINQGYKFAIEEDDAENPTLFAGALGLARFFDGENAKDIELNTSFVQNPSLIGGNAAPIPGENRVSNSMVQMQYQKIEFYDPSAGTKKLLSTDSLDGFFRMSVTDVATLTASSKTNAETSQALLNAVVNEFDSISKVDLDEELTNLMKYQTGYSASAKVISTIDQMIQTLLGIKQ